jgi:hypothetical protein
MKPAIAIALLVAALALLLAVHLHDEAHRYDVVVAAAGSGGSQENEGSTQVVGYLVDHKTGRVWLLESAAQLPVRVMNCSVYGDARETEKGCEVQAGEKPLKNPY